MRKNILAEYDPRKYCLGNGLEYWFDGRYNRIRTSDQGFFLQIVKSSDFGDIQKRLFVSINGRRVQFSRKNNETLVSPICVPPAKKNGKWVWEIEEIGAPLNFNTVFEDGRRGTQRPINERRQCLTNASRFATSEDQNKAIDLVKAAFSTFGNIFGADPTFGREQPGHSTVEFSRELGEQVRRGSHLDL